MCGLANVSPQWALFIIGKEKSTMSFIRIVSDIDFHLWWRCSRDVHSDCQLVSAANWPKWSRWRHMSKTNSFCFVAAVAVAAVGEPTERTFPAASTEYTWAVYASDSDDSWTCSNRSSNARDSDANSNLSSCWIHWNWVSRANVYHLSWLVNILAKVIVWSHSFRARFCSFLGFLRVDDSFWSRWIPVWRTPSWSSNRSLCVSRRNVVLENREALPSFRRSFCWARIHVDRIRCASNWTFWFRIECVAGVSVVFAIWPSVPSHSSDRIRFSWVVLGFSAVAAMRLVAAMFRDLSNVAAIADHFGSCLRNFVLNSWQFLVPAKYAEMSIMPWKGVRWRRWHPKHKSPNVITLCSGICSGIRSSIHSRTSHPTHTQTFDELLLPILLMSVIFWPTVCVTWAKLPVALLRNFCEHRPCFSNRTISSDLAWFDWFDSCSLCSCLSRSRWSIWASFYKRSKFGFVLWKWETTAPFGRQSLFVNVWVFECVCAWWIVCWITWRKESLLLVDSTDNWSESNGWFGFLVLKLGKQHKPLYKQENITVRHRNAN